MILLIGYLYWINVITFIAYAVDKRCAYYSFRRFSESCLITFACLGGAFGAWFAMWLFRHKTRHKKFTITVPLVLLLWTGVIVLIRLCGFI